MRIFTLVFLTTLSLLLACDPSTPEQPIPDDLDNNTPKNYSDGAETDILVDTTNGQELLSIPFWKSKTAPDTSELAILRRFVPEGHRIMDWEYGDLNGDAKTQDVILITQNAKAEAKDNMSNDRTIHILTRSEDGQLKKQKSNSNIVLCAGCGGMMGDPYMGITIENGHFSLEHFGGSSWRWAEIITFKYNEVKKDWFLHKKEGSSFHASQPDEIEETVQTTQDFGVIQFEDYVNGEEE